MPDQEEDLQVKPVWVPQLFYDIIARLIPGTVLIGVFYISISGLEASLKSMESWLGKPSGSYPPITVIAALDFVFSYTLAVILLGGHSGISAIFLYARNLLLWIIKKLSFMSRLTINQQTQKPRIDIKTKEEKMKMEEEFSKKYDFIKRKDPAAGSRITKLNTEIDMAEILMLGFGLSLAMNYFKIVKPTDSLRDCLLLLLSVALVGSIFAQRHLVIRFRRAVENYAEILDYAKGKTTNNRLTDNNIDEQDEKTSSLRANPEFMEIIDKAREEFEMGKKLTLEETKFQKADDYSDSRRHVRAGVSARPSLAL